MSCILEDIEKSTFDFCRWNSSISEVPRSPVRVKSAGNWDNSYLKNIGHGVILSSDLLRDFDVNNTIYTLNCQNNNLAIAICTNVDKKLYIDNLSINPDYRSYHIKILAVVINYLNITSQDQKVILDISRLPDFMKFDINL